MSAKARSTSGPGRPPGDYGVDAPYLLAVAGALVIAGVMQGSLTRQPWSIAGAALVLLFSALGFYANRFGKFLVWSDLLDDLRLRVDELVLDLGCGRGAVLILAAARLTSGRAVGIDVWRARDQSGNALAVTQGNAVAAGVADRGGRLLIADFRATARYAARLRAAGLTVTRHSLGWRMWWSGPWLATRLVSAAKAPPGSSAGSISR